ncbi:OB-fold domain-containing protein [Rhodococcus sp. BP-149]|uniref:thiolase C-terminal domain-containing protein n=1 Tax=unclassified Rhodococcus (in: high G+C Gram-positive bacteria) TaxID=192944 RepID=UPI001C9B29EB|nr:MULTISPECIES: OB-fold domain-containing protein [unclassified Rhodococcus (in: high G+C Gram-positive bacteria)]MBY6687784.1 OB-fold domain-containing protein [Rhodococcus sp. BP-288]MBY6696049.1 OB-fold domain-containing protein [Rhodococcus sp. BP-188]MBY6700646.1 OB-fold domain-containing protein [Rhodococcus sp. BP-285]MBY6705043.1 OB-fold domain-containing protein [Rhodococcus sp. BP-283]MBY6713771.1 OB-fold domain-containing protein [Rhodococcus sp. BP-160]
MTPAPSRPIPVVTPETEFYWTSGEDGRLRMQSCVSCAGLIHPPRPMCPYCRSKDTTVRTVSGFASLFGFTVNERFALPGLTPPYVVAQVALIEDPRVRLTTSVVDCVPEDLVLGMQMEVVFENVDDVWLPLFRPTTEQVEPEPLPEDEIDAAEYSAWIRPMAAPHKFEDKVAITGIGASDIGRRLMVDPLSLTIQACERAVADAGLTLDDIDGLSTYPGSGADSGFSEGGTTALESALRIRPTWYNGGGETFGPGGSVIAAMLAVASGLARHVLCFRTLWQSTHETLMREGKLASPGGGRVSGPMMWTIPFGGISAAHTLSMNAQRHFHKYGTTRETLGWVALNQRANAALNPTAIYREPLTMDDYMNARPITTPFGLNDCDVPCDGAVAVIVSAVDAARDLAKPPVLVEAVGTQIVERLEWDQSTSTHEPQVLGPAAHLWTRTDLTPGDVDVAELYDGFTFNCVSWIEALGFCKIGEAKDFLDGGHNIARDGVLPLNTNGGQLSHGRTHGMGLLYEAVSQLRGEAGARQVSDAKVAAVASGGLTPSGVMLLRADR